jgi:hypothetical protein
MGNKGFILKNLIIGIISVAIILAAGYLFLREAGKPEKEGRKIEIADNQKEDIFSPSSYHIENPPYYR